MLRASHGPETGLARKFLSSAGLGFLASAALAAPAHADTASSVFNTANAPGIEDGVWATDAPSGLVVSIAYEGQKFNITSYSPSGDYAKGELKDQITGWGQCVFIDTKYVKLSPLDKTEADDPNNPCADQLLNTDDPSDHVKQRNQCELGVNKECVSGKAVDIIPDCEELTAYDKFSAAAKDPSNIDWPQNQASGPSHPVGTVTTQSVNFRFTWKNPDDKGHFYSKVKSTQYGWVWMRRKCLRVQFKGSPKGGDPKLNTAQPGPNPNGGPLH
jgi:hypothetical protein